MGLTYLKPAEHEAVVEAVECAIDGEELILRSGILTPEQTAATEDRLRVLHKAADKLRRERGGQPPQTERINHDG